MYCKYCGEIIDNDSLFCSHCGGKLDGPKNYMSSKIEDTVLWDDIPPDDIEDIRDIGDVALTTGTTFRVEKKIIEAPDNLTIYLVSNIKEEVLKRYKCKVCGYTHEGAVAPHKCPLCHVYKENFKKSIEQNECVIGEWYEDENGKRITKEYKGIRYLGYGLTALKNNEGWEIGRFRTINGQVKVTGPKKEFLITNIDNFQDKNLYKGVCKIDTIKYCAKVYTSDKELYLGDNFNFYLVEKNTIYETHPDNEFYSNLSIYILYVSIFSGILLISELLSYIMSLIGLVDDFEFFSIEFNIIALIVTVLSFTISYFISRNSRRHRYKYEYNVFQYKKNKDYSLILCYDEITPWYED